MYAVWIIIGFLISSISPPGLEDARESTGKIAPRKNLSSVILAKAGVGRQEIEFKCHGQLRAKKETLWGH